MARFHVGNTTFTEFCIDSSAQADGSVRSAPMVFSPWTSKSPPNIGAGGKTLVLITNVTHHPATHSTTFSIEPVKDAEGIAFVTDLDTDDDLLLRLTIGKVKNHDGFQSDLIAELLGRSESAVKLSVYTRILNKKNNIVGD